MNKKKIPFPTPINPAFTFIDLFAGVGGFRISLTSLNGLCVFSSEIEKNAQLTYLKNFGELPHGDITTKEVKEQIPNNFDILCGGFPCQSFSIAGHRKGFEDTRGTLFFDVASIIEKHKPKVVFLENVKNLLSHDNGKTFTTMKETLEELGYHVYFKVMNAMEYANIPQNRERIFMVCFDPKQVPNYRNFSFPEKTALTNSIHNYTNKNEQDQKYFYTDKFKHYDQLKETITSNNTLYQWRRQYVRENKSNVCPTLTANMGTGGHNVPLIKTPYGIRKLTPRECFNFQGFPKEFGLPTNISLGKQYMQAGNSVVVPLIKKISESIISVL